VIVGRLIMVLVIVILGAVASMELFKFLVTILPLLTVLTVGVLIFGGWMRRKRRF
jgi:hypothetical protein